MMGAGGGIEQGDAQRDCHWGLVRLAGRGGERLVQMQVDHLGHRIMIKRGADVRGSGLFIPATELGEVDLAALLHRQDEILTGGGLAVMAIEIEIGARAEALRP